MYINYPSEHTGDNLQKPPHLLHLIVHVHACTHWVIKYCWNSQINSIVRQSIKNSMCCSEHETTILKSGPILKWLWIVIQGQTESNALD